MTGERGKREVRVRGEGGEKGERSREVVVVMSNCTDGVQKYLT